MEGGATKGGVLAALASIVIIYTFEHSSSFNFIYLFFFFLFFWFFFFETTLPALPYACFMLICVNVCFLIFVTYLSIYLNTSLFMHLFCYFLYFLFSCCLYQQLVCPLL